MIGRPSEFSQETADAICEKLADGESLRSICLADEMPAKSTVFKWLGQHSDFADQYARAREAQADTLADDIVDIADDGTNDWMKRQRDDGTTEDVLNHEHIARSKLRVDARKWVAAKLKPKKYGDKIDVTSGGDKLASDIDPTARAVWLNAWANQVRGQAGEPSDDAG